MERILEAADAMGSGSVIPLEPRVAEGEDKDLGEAYGRSHLNPRRRMLIWLRPWPSLRRCLEEGPSQETRN